MTGVRASGAWHQGRRLRGARGGAACLLALFVCVALLCVPAPARAQDIFPSDAREFLDRLDAAVLSRVGVQLSGRVGPLDTLAREQLKQLAGTERPDGLPPAVACLELFLNSGRYADRPLIYVSERTMRTWLAGRLDAASAGTFRRTHRLPPACLLDEEGWGLLLATGRATAADKSRCAAIRSLREDLPELADRREFRVPLDRLSLRYGAYLAQDVLRVIPAASGRWQSAEGVLSPQAASQPAGPVATAWRQLRDAWLARDAARTDAAAGRLSDALGGAAGAAYPTPLQQSLELLYNRTRQGTVVFAGFAAALVLLIIAAAGGGRFARRAGLAVFAVSTAMLVAGFAARWVISGRSWYLPPIMNQFEAVVGSAMLGALLAVVLELLWPQNWFALAAALYATVALLMGFFLPGQMGAGIGAQHGILASPVMAVHVAVIIVGHALVGMTMVISLAYLGVALFAGMGSASPSAAAGLVAAGQPGPLAAIDRCNLIVAQLAAWTVVAGTILGAYWGDFAWGRWWGWDPKETWALITALVYVALLHARFVTPPRARGLVTASACLLGSGVMLFNWIVVNYFLTGKHSYA